jgi:methionine-rich copper-binding protein CopC
VAGSSAHGPDLRRFGWLLPALVLFAGVAFGRPLQGVEAHASFDYAEPAADSRLRQAPSQLTLHFTQGLKQDGSWVLLRDSSDRDLPVTVEFDAADRKVMRAKLQSLRPGVYTVKWQTLSADDDDYSQGSYRLTILNPDGSDPDSENAIGEPEAGSGSDGDGGSVIVPFMVAAVVLLAIAAGAIFWSRRRAS